AHDHDPAAGRDHLDSARFASTRNDRRALDRAESREPRLPQHRRSELRGDDRPGVVDGAGSQETGLSLVQTHRLTRRHSLRTPLANLKGRGMNRNLRLATLAAAVVAVLALAGNAFATQQLFVTQSASSLTFKAQ